MIIGALHPRSRGIKQGLFVFLLTFLIVPLLVVFSIITNLRTPALVVVAAILLVVGGLLRMAYAKMFESPIAGGHLKENQSSAANQLSLNKTNPSQLPSPQSFPISDYAAPQTGNWRDTNELEPRSVTEGTTRLLENKETD